VGIDAVHQVLSREKALEKRLSGGRKQQKARQMGRARGSFSAKAGGLRRGRSRQFRALAKLRSARPQGAIAGRDGRGPQTDLPDGQSGQRSRRIAAAWPACHSSIDRMPRITRTAIIVSYRDKRTERFAHGDVVREFSGFARQAEIRLDRPDAATSLKDLAGLPGNRLERLKGDRQAQYSIRVNDQWRICFEWPEGSPGPVNVEIVD
jgi:proteic killer suppression protein